MQKNIILSFMICMQIDFFKILPLACGQEQ
jgi:hypothetical protein